ncbi:glycosyltransferase family 2 protein [Microbulbifer sp. MLAF003]|uniref:glycosyltransferase family 2 protein n=1 Tax=Microbulbifer sp. MLAF003 TaxID=3032582 RepID=UPI0024AC90B6|nr:glycosyltransferase family 2 protein [Microbulbifer sp. MLAF003]WHI50417.1 glycosyltransferase family 2 protein [Microbulbifer sp. MLAF003]
MKFGIAAIFKNEYEYILEWIVYHQLIGVDAFYIADNVSDDGSSQLLEALDSLGVIKGFISPELVPVVHRCLLIIICYIGSVTKLTSCVLLMLMNFLSAQMAVI